MVRIPHDYPSATASTSRRTLDRDPSVHASPQVQFSAFRNVEWIAVAALGVVGETLVERRQRVVRPVFVSEFCEGHLNSPRLTVAISHTSKQLSMDKVHQMTNCLVAR